MRWGVWRGTVIITAGIFRASKTGGTGPKILNTIGISGERVRMYNLSSGEGPLFAEIAAEMMKRFANLGPNPIKLAK